MRGRKYVCGYNELEEKICLWLQWIGEEGNMFVVTMDWRGRKYVCSYNELERVNMSIVTMNWRE